MKRIENIPVESKKFAAHASRRLLEKVDPYRVLFTAKELKDFQEDSQKHWSDWLVRQDCKFFENSIQQRLTSSKDRLFKRLDQLNMVSFLKAHPMFHDASHPVHYPKPSDFAKNETELNSRFEKLVGAIVKDSPAGVVDAYDGNYKELITDTLNETLFENLPKPQNLLSKAVIGTIDPYSTYFSNQEFQEFYDDLSGGLSGIGIHIRKVNGGLLIEKLVADSPADHSKKIEIGDILVNADGFDLSHLPARVAKHLLKGKEGSKTTLLIRKKKTKQLVKVQLVRERFAFEESQILARVVKTKTGPIGFISIPSFYGRGGVQSYDQEHSVAEDFKTVFTTKFSKPPKALVIDLRGNPGGFLEEAVTIAGYFIGTAPVVKVVESDHSKVMRSDEAPIYTGPLLVLVDDGTASAAEVLAGALEDYRRAVVIGTSHTYGKGTVQKLFHLDDELLQTNFNFFNAKGVVKLTTSIFYSPKGHSPANGGIAPNIYLPQLDDNDSDYGTPEAVSVPEESPIDEAAPQVASISDATLSQLKKLSTKRTSQLEGSEKVASLAPELKELDATDTVWELGECLNIANDLAPLQSESIAISEPKQLSR